MKRLFEQKELIFFILGIILFFGSVSYAIWESKIADVGVLKQAETQIQQDFDGLLASLGTANKESMFPTCEVSYNQKGEIVHWTGKAFLPSIDTLKQGLQMWNEKETLFETRNRIYYVVPDLHDSLIRYHLIPLYIRYEITNNYLPPYLFMGRYYDSQTANALAATISTTHPSNDHPFITIRNKRHAPIFYIQNIDETIIRGTERTIVIILGFIGFLFLLIGLYQYLLNKKKWALWKCDVLLLAIVLALRLVLGYFELPYSYLQLTLFSSADTLAFEYGGVLIPSLGDLLLDVIIFYLFSWIFYRICFSYYIEKLYNRIADKPVILWILCTVAIGLSVYGIKEYLALIQIIFENSQLKIDFSNILAFSRSLLSQFLLLGLGLTLLSCYLVISVLLKLPILAIQSRGIMLRSTLALLFLVVLLGWTAWIFNANLTDTIVVFLTIALWGVVLYLQPHRVILQYDLLNYILFIGACSLLLCIKIVNYNFDKRAKNVEIIAERTFKDRQNTIYSAYDHALSRFENDTSLVLSKEVNKKYEANKNNPEKFLEWFKHEHFTPYFKDTKLQFFLFDKQNKRLGMPNTPNNASIHPAKDNFSLINLGSQSTVSEELTQGFYRVKNYDAEIYDDIYVSIFSMGELKFQLQIYPTRFDVSRVFPALLQDNDSRQGVEELKEYQVAFYGNDILRSSMGPGTFPQTVQTHKDSALLQKQIFNHNDYQDYLFAIDSDKAIMIRYSYPRWTDYISTLSLVFFFFGVFTLLTYLCYIFIYRIFKNKIPFVADSLQFKFQLLLLGLSGFILLVISIFLLVTIRSRFYSENIDTLHGEMLNLANAISIEYKDVRLRPSPVQESEILQDFNARLKDLGEKTASDINIYSHQGQLIASNQPLVKETGLSSGLMNAEAYQLLSTGNTSEAFLQEYIGNTEFLSAYKAIYLGDELGIVYLNVPYFDKTEELNQKTTNLLGFIISILLLLVILVSFITVYLTRYFTYPLKLIQERLTNTQFGDINTPISYEQKDEIGAIVQAYNQMLEKLKASEKSLAQNERDLAWRQMAKQVAHEIKNPLTPMKLSIQHLIRAWNDKKPNLEMMFPKVTQTILIQIDSLSRIADNFSEFARMPETVKNNIVLNDVIREVVILYTQNDNITIEDSIDESPFIIYADRDQISRVFNNLIKNAIQAIENKDEVGKVDVKMEVKGDMAYLRIADNGCGMTEEVKKRAFEPNFSTKSSGMGLGLAMSKRIIEIGQGEIRFESEEGEGTTFYIEFPRSREN